MSHPNPVHDKENEYPDDEKVFGFHKNQMEVLADLVKKTWTT